MSEQFVRVLCDVHCEWDGLPPIYRLFVDKELFAERTWIWEGSTTYLEEALQIQAKPGTYKIKHCLVAPNLAKLQVKNFRVTHGPATVDQTGTLRIDHAPA